MKVKVRFRIETGNGDAYRWAYSPRQACWLVYQEESQWGQRKSFLECLSSWKVFRV